MSGYVTEKACGECYQYITDTCPDDVLILPVGLSQGTEARWEIENKFGQKWRGSSTVNADEELEIPVSSFPAGMFNAHAGIFTLKVLGINGDDDLCEGIDLTICGEDYACIAFSFTNITEVESEPDGSGYGY